MYFVFHSISKVVEGSLHAMKCNFGVIFIAILPEKAMANEEM